MTSLLAELVQATRACSQVASQLAQTASGVRDLLLARPLEQVTSELQVALALPHAKVRPIGILACLDMKL